MKSKVYIETGVISYLTARMSRDLITAGHQPWNCNHIANAEIRKNILKLCSQIGYEMPVICTPEELMEGR